MGDYIAFDDDLVDTVRGGITDMINYLGYDCKLFYPGVFAKCPNCLTDATGHKSFNKFRNGGPVYFPDNTICPVCQGVGNIGTATYEVIKLALEIFPQNYREFAQPEQINLTAGTLDVLGFYADMPKMQRADYIIPFININPNNQNRYRLLGDPLPNGNIAKGCFFSVRLEKIS